MADCNHDCSHCASNCGERTEKQSFIEKPHELTHIKKIIGVVSGKGGVGKSLITSILAVMMNNKGYKTAIMDADITGPSIPKAFGITDHPKQDGDAFLPVKSKTGISVMSVNLLLDNPADPVIWRGPVIAGAVKQFWSEVIWGDIDYMFIDMPPGTGDVALTVFQSIPIDGVIIVTSPQELVSMIVEKAVNMAKAMDIPVLGLVENMSYVKCPDCGKEITVFGKSNIDEIAKNFNIPVLARIPMQEETSRAVDAGDIESLDIPELKEAAKTVEKLLK